jgi:magnesium chelatase family protein
MLAKALPSILPPMTHEEILEVTHLHSLAGKEYEHIIRERPVRSPHHSASVAAVIGGGSSLRPGEISLSHRGVLFFDELPEFNRHTIEALRQPLEDRVISLARLKETIDYPADFMLVATANPCPCGRYGSSQACHCPPASLKRYHNKLSGPILDRIDLYSYVHEVDYDSLLNTSQKPEDDAAVAKRVQTARQLQAERYQSGLLNGSLDNQAIKRFAKPTKAAVGLLNTAGERLHLSARAYMRALRVARTIADLAGSPVIELEHVSEALQYRNNLQNWVI